MNLLRTDLDDAKVGYKYKLDSFRRLESVVRATETHLEPQANHDAVIDHEEAISPSLYGRSVFDEMPRQRLLF
jgi:hypothetical protein